MRGKQQDFRTEKYIRYGIRKFSFGAASVAIAVGLMFLGNGVVSATEVQSAETAITTSASSQGDKETEKAEPKAETVETVKPETVSPETIKPETVNPETVKPETVNPETVNSETMKPETVNPETEKATEVKSEVAATKAATKATLANTDASQADVDAQAETVSALSTAVTESNTAEKKLRPTEIYTTNGTPGTAGTAVKTNAKYANSVETVDNNKRGNRENTDSINQRRRVKRSAIDTTKFAQNYDRKVLSGSVTNTGFSVSDPDYPSGMWIDPDKSHYSYEWVQTKYHGNQIVLSTNRTGDGIVYVTELSPSNKVLKQYTLNQNTKVPSAVFDSTTYYNDTYYAMVESLRDPLAVKYIASKYDTGYYNKLYYMVPKLITQTTYFVDKDGKQITDSNGNPVVPYTQKGLVGQKYTTSPILINGYYATASSNSNGAMSPYGEIGASYVKDFHDGIVVTYTQTGSDGTMSASIAQNGKVLETYTNIKPSDPVIKYQVGYTTVAIKNPYIPQTSDVKYVYRKLGNWVVSNPDGSTKSIIYPNDPIDPTKIADSSVPGYPVIDFLPGYTPKDHMGTPLVPVDPDDRTKGYIPPIPSDIGKDTTITYTADTQKATVTYVVEGTGTVLHTDNLEGKSGEPIDYSTVAKLAELKALGYDLVTDGFTTATDKNFDKDTKVDQSFVVTVKPHVEPIKPVDPENPNDPNKPKPGDPIDPNNPDGPKWTEDLIKQIDTTRHVNRTITSVNEKGEEVAQKVTDKVTFTREGKINSVTGEITYGNWTAKDGDTTFDKVESPVVQGYILKDAKQKEVAATTGLTVDSKDENIEVVYTKLGSWVPKVPEGFEEPKLDKPQYPNDPTDPTKPGTPTTVIPQVPGTTPKDSNGNPLKPVDPNDPSKGYVPPTPENPTEDTVITYEKDSQKATVTYVVEGTGTVLHTDNLEGKSGEPIDYSTVAKLAELKALGYDLVTDGFTTATDKNFDKDTKVDQSFVVTVKPHVEPIKPVDPENPNDPNKPKPGDPIDPNNPDGPKWTEDLIKQIDTTRHVNRTITSVNEKGEEVAQKVTDKVTFTREGKINSVTGEITYGNWTAKDGDTTFDKVESPVVQGYILKDAKQKEVAATTGLTVDSKDENIEVVYTKLGSWVPKVPEGFEEPKLDKPQYPNDPTDPTKPGTPTTVIPQVPGTTPKDSNGNPLKPVDPNDPSKGYVPPTPENPTEDTVITYEKDSQKATVTYVVEGTGTVLHTDNLEGKSGEPIDYSTVAKLAELKALGYDLVTDGFTTATDKNFDKDTKVDQSFVVTVKPHVEPIKPVDPENPNDPNKPKPGDPIDPNNPDGPKWTEDLIKQIDTTRHVNRTITSVNEKGEEVAQKVTDKVTFTREGKINSVTGEITYGNWTAKDGDTTFDKVESPVVQGYILKDAKQKEVAATTGLTVDSKDENIEVVYTKLGSWVPKVPEGFEEPKLDKPQYPNDPTDPTKPGTPTTVIPQVPGTTPKDSNGNPLKPVDPNDPSKGYVPPTPENPTEDTVITYEKDSQKATVTYVVEGTGTVLHTDNLEGKSGEPIDYSTVAKLAELKALGYDLVTDGFTTATDKNFDKDTKVDQSFVVTVKPHVEPIKPVDPENPNDPNKPKPGDPIDPNNPDGPKWTEDLIKQIDTTRHVNRTITSVNEKGEEVAQKVTDKVTFTREGKINSVTGEITYGNWTAKDGDTTFDKVESPVVQGYILKDAKQKEVAATTGLTVDSKDENIEVVYTKLGSWVPKVPEGFEEPKLDKPQYPNDPTDPTKPGTPTTVIPQVPGTTPKDSNGNPLKPVDPNDPSKGYVPPTPENPTEDTVITYEKDSQKATVTYVVEGTGTVLHTDNLEGKSGEPIDYSTVAKLAELKALGYDLVTDGFTTATDKNFDKDTKVDQSFVVTVKPHVEPIKPVDPENPNDPNKPKPGDPIDPNNPDGPKWTEDLIKQIDTTRHVNRTITSVNEKGEEVAQKVTDKVTFTREGKINSVTGEITYGNWTAKDGDTTFDKVESPVVQGYILKDAKQKEVAATTGLTVDSKDENIEVVYTKLGSWVPKVPEGFEEPKLDKPQYPNDPTDPTKPGTPTTVIPQVPGTTPKDSNGNPLKPVDPNDPSKGYVPPTPENPTEDTVITYEKDSQKATVTYVVEGTGTVLHTDNLEGKSGEPIDYSTVAKLAELKALGYDLVTDGFTTATDKNFDKDTKVDQSFVVTVKPHVEPIKPVDPENPNDPNKPKPGDPIDPNNPDGPKWTEDLIKQIDTTRHVNRTITSVNEKGEEVAQKVTDKVTFTREGKINSVTGEITYGNWTAKDGDTTFDKVESPVVQGYILKDAKQKEVAATTGLTVDSKDENIEVVYTKLGSWVPKVPEGFEEPKLDKPQYPNDPTDPTKPGTPTTVIPQVPGTTPKDSNGNPLKPVDPNDPSKGYVPPTPENPTEDTPINYVPVPQPVRPTDNGDNNGTPTTAAQPASPSTPQYMDGKRELPNTGTEDNASLAALGLLGVLSGFGLVARKKKED
ncbi:mucin-binding protein [Streptococcus thermophilus]|uniref:mucin-binding protein n=1 Tax=Streptococcus thermophilus TaxID=1308 RepID=UPI0032191806